MNNLKAVAYNEKLLRKLQDVFLDLDDMCDEGMEDPVLSEKLNDCMKHCGQRIAGLTHKEA